MSSEREGRVDASELTDDTRLVSLARLEGLVIYAVPMAILVYAAPRLLRDGFDLRTALTVIGHAAGIAAIRVVRRRGGIRLRSQVILVYLLWLGLQGLVLHGPEIGVGALMLGTMAMGAVFLGRRGMPFVTASVLGTFGVGGALHVLGIAPSLDATANAPSHPGTWLRMGAAIGVVGLALAAVIIRVLELLEEERKTAVLALARERREVAERARTEAALERAQRAEALGRLAGGIAHDINNALAVVLGNAEVLAASSTLSRRDATLAQTIAQAAESAGETTKQLLALGRRDVADGGSCDASEVVTSLCTLLERSFPATIRIETRLADKAEVPLRRGSLEQVLLNLTFNARDAMPDGGRLEIETEVPVQAGPPRVLIRVRDDGAGLDEATRTRIFDPFFTTKPPERGSGLGLSMVHALVSGAGGSVRVDSTPGRGSCFTIELPWAAADPPPITISGSFSLGLSGLRILLVEDDAGVRGMLADSLRAEDAEVIEAADGDVALTRMQDGLAFDLLLTDAVFPGTPVDTVIDRFRAAFPTSPILVASGYVAPPGLRTRIAAGEVLFLQKPFSRRALREALVAATTSPRTPVVTPPTD